MLVLDALFRYSAFALVMILFVIAIRDARDNVTARFAAFLCITVAAMLLTTAHPDLVLPHSVHSFLRFLDFPSLVFAWWFGRSLFEDDFRLGWLEWLVMALIAIPVLWFRLYELEFVTVLPNSVIYGAVSLSIALMAHLIYVALNGRQDDLLETRRRARVYFALGLAGSTIAILVAERLFWATHPDVINTVRAAVFLLLAAWGALWMLSLQTDKLLFETKPKSATPVKATIDPRDQALYESLLTEMEVKKAYTEGGLTIRSLAERLNTQEHRLRILINTGMGYRNFSGFVNSYRIEAIKQAMQHSDNARTPILTLAMNVGFNSLAPFNRAFLNSTGQTPSAYRAQFFK